MIRGEVPSHEEFRAMLPPSGLALLHEIEAFAGPNRIGLGQRGTTDHLREKIHADFGMERASIMFPAGPGAHPWTPDDLVHELVHIYRQWNLGAPWLSTAATDTDSWELVGQLANHIEHFAMRAQETALGARNVAGYRSNARQQFDYAQKPGMQPVMVRYYALAGWLFSDEFDDDLYSEALGFLRRAGGLDEAERFKREATAAIDDPVRLCSLAVAVFNLTNVHLVYYDIRNRRIVRAAVPAWAPRRAATDIVRASL